LAIDRHLPTLACLFALVVSPILIFSSYTDPHALDSRLENRIFWPVMAVITLALLLKEPSRFLKPSWPPHIILLLTYLGFAGMSVVWAFSPQSSLIRFIQQVMIVLSIVLPARLARRADLMRGMFFCFALSLVLSGWYTLSGSVTLVQYGSELADIGYQGYFEGKNYLGECAAVALLLSLYEASFSGWRRAIGITFVIVSVTLLVLSNSKTALGLAIVCPIIAQTTLAARRVTRASAATIILIIPLTYYMLSSLTHFNMDRVAYNLYHDSTLTGRTIIWAFAQLEIARRPLVGWGYQSFWFVPNSPAISDAPGWVKMMPNAHNGYYDTMLEMEYVGLAQLLAFIIATLHAVGRVAATRPGRGSCCRSYSSSSATTTSKAYGCAVSNSYG
jgi:O-antigen ligase